MRISTQVKKISFWKQKKQSAYNRYRISKESYGLRNGQKAKQQNQNRKE